MADFNHVKTWEGSVIFDMILIRFMDEMVLKGVFPTDPVLDRRNFTNDSSN